MKYLISSELNTEFSKKLYITVFIFSIILGRGYPNILELLIKGKCNGCKIDIEKKLFSVKLDDKLFGSSIERFSVRNGKNISFNLAVEIVELYKYIQKQILYLPDESQKNLYKNEKKYIEFIDKKRNSCSVYINFDLKNIWKLLATYSKKLFDNNIASLYCLGKYNTLDRSALSYASTHKSGQIHSNFLNNFLKNLDIQKCIYQLIDIDKIISNEKYLFDSKMEYVGSSRLIRNEDIKIFFSYMRREMLHEDDQIKYFNLYAIYARYALSILLGTRYGRVSCNLKDVSFELNLIRIIEKSDDKRSGVRYIPLCRQAKIIIRKYKSLCSELGLMGNDIYFFNKGKKQILYGENKKVLVNIMHQDYALDQNILNFIRKVPLNYGRHILVKDAVEKNFNMYYLQALMGHYTKGTEQHGIVSSMDSQDFILKSSSFLEGIGKEYGI
jgi:site-specific recombinase XerD